MQLQTDKIQVHYILSRNRSGSTLLNNLLNNHINIKSITELNAYWLLKTDYNNRTTFDSRTIEKLIDDLFFVLSKKGHDYFIYMLPSKAQLLELITKQIESLTFLKICDIINSEIKATLNKKNKITTLVHKEINFNHLVNEIHLDSPKSKFIFLVRNHRANIYSALKFNSARKNYIYEAKRWSLDFDPLLNSVIPENQKLIVRYEDLIINTEKCLKKILLFLGVELTNTLNDISHQLSKQSLYEEAKKSKITEEEIELFIKHHLGSFSPVNQNKINEWDDSNAFNQSQLDKIDYICRNVATRIGYECSDKNISLSFSDRYYIFLAIIDNYVVTRYLSIPIKYKRMLAKLNYFKFFN
jgi:hypothetical protein